MTVTQTLFGIKGRIRRSQYWGYSILQNIVFVLIAGLLVLIARARGAPDGELDHLTTGLFLISLIPLCWVGFCIIVKRCHDRDRSGWVLLFWFVPFIGLLWLLWLVLVELPFFDGTKGDNRFGPSPKGIASSPRQIANIFE